MTEHWHIRRLALLLVCVLLFCVSCANGEAETEDAVPTGTVKTAQPAEGIGRPESTDSPESKPQAAEPNFYTVCIDPGHGFVDGGTGEGVFEDGLLEKDINLAVSKLLAEDLQLMGFTVIMTHNGVDLPAADRNANQIFNVKERSAYVNTLDVDYLVSIHVNAFDDPTVNGVHIYCEQNGNKINSWSEPIAREISDAIVEAFPDGKEPRLWVSEPGKTLEMTRETKAAASLVEIGFCTNETDRNNMIDPEWQAAFAQAIANGINAFFESEEV